jgi:hypothetical protein
MYRYMSFAFLLFCCKCICDFFFLFSLDNMCASYGRFLSLFLFFLKFSPHVIIEGNLEILMEEIFFFYDSKVKYTC